MRLKNLDGEGWEGSGWVGKKGLEMHCEIEKQHPNKDSMLCEIFLQTAVIYASKRWQQEGRPCIFHSRQQVHLPDFEFISRLNNTSTQGNFYSNLKTIHFPLKAKSSVNSVISVIVKAVFVLMLLFGIEKDSPKNISLPG